MTGFLVANNSIIVTTLKLLALLLDQFYCDSCEFIFFEEWSGSDFRNWYVKDNMPKLGIHQTLLSKYLLTIFQFKRIRVPHLRMIAV